MKKVILPILAVVLAVGLVLPMAPVFVSAASPPQPTYGKATVDGIIGEWDLVNDFFADMYEAGNPDKDVLSKLYLRYDCENELLYVLVLVEDGYDGERDEAEAWIKVYDIGPSVLPWAEFEWVEANPTETVRGYEASTSLAPGSYTTEKIEVHINVVSDRTSSTGRPLENRIELVIDCPTEVGGEVYPIRAVGSETGVSPLWVGLGVVLILAIGGGIFGLRRLTRFSHRENMRRWK